MRACVPSSSALRSVVADAGVDTDLTVAVEVEAAEAVAVARSRCQYHSPRRTPCVSMRPCTGIGETGRFLTT